MWPFRKIAQILSVNALLLATITGLAARAELILVEPSKVIAPSKTTIVMPDTVVVPSSVVTPVTKRTVIMGVSSPKKESTTFLSLKIGPAPEFNKRLNLMREQIQNGLAKGWLNDAAADALMSEHKRLEGMVIALRANYTQNAADDIEKGLNLLNIRVADSFKTAGAGVMQ